MTSAGQIRGKIVWQLLIFCRGAVTAESIRKDTVVENFHDPMSLAVAPDFANNQRDHLYYSDPENLLLD